MTALPFFVPFCPQLWNHSSSSVGLVHMSNYNYDYIIKV